MTISNFEISRHLPLTAAVFHILLALADEDRHGYGIMKEVALRTGGKIQMGPGTLYGTLKRMQKDELITEVEALEAPDAGTDRRRYYRMTALGRMLARAESERLQALVQVAKIKQLLPA